LLGVTIATLVGTLLTFLGAKVESRFPSDGTAAAELLGGLPFVNMKLVDRDAFEHFARKTFATDRNLVAKGMVEVIP
jgi:hypothetical protein